jgi:hypothetical protein
MSLLYRNIPCNRADCGGEVCEFCRPEDKPMSCEECIRLLAWVPAMFRHEGYHGFDGCRENPWCPRCQTDAVVRAHLAVHANRTEPCLHLHLVGEMGSSYRECRDCGQGVK